MIDQLNTICQQSMRRHIAPDDDIIAAGLNANRALSIIKTFWLSTGVELDVNVFYCRRSVRAIVAAVTNGHTENSGKIVKLRDGDATKPFFLYAGGVSCFLEMQDLIDSLSFDGVIYGIKLTDFDRCPSDPPILLQEVLASLSAVKSIAPQGPYRVGGYSFGGVFALELARRLISNGDKTELVAMIDSPQNDHSWSWWNWAGLMRSTLARQIRQRWHAKPTVKHTAQDSAAITLLAQCPARRGHQLAFRFRSPKNQHYPSFAPQWAGGYTPRYAKAARQLIQMKGLFRPRTFAGNVLFIHSAGGSPIDCDARTIWKTYLPNAEWVRVAGNHQSMIVGRNARTVAATLDDGLGAQSRLVADNL